MDHQGDDGGFGFGRSLERGVLVFRWVTLAWMTVLAVTGGDEFRRPVLAWASLAVAAGWTLWLTLGLRQWTAGALAVDLAVCSYLMLISAVVVFEGDIEASRPFFAAGYPFSAALSWGAARGPWAGLAAGVVLGALYVMTRPLNGMAVDSFFSRGGQTWPRTSSTMSSPAPLWGSSRACFCAQERRFNAQTISSSVNVSRLRA